MDVPILLGSDTPVIILESGSIYIPLRPLAILVILILWPFEVKYFTVFNDKILATVFFTVLGTSWL